MSSRYGLIGFLVAVMALLESATTAATNYTVGGDGFGWAVPSNNSFYDDWVKNKTFQIGDSVIFNWTGTHTATEVRKEYYENCTKSGTDNMTPGVIINFKMNATLYYICSISTHCELGQKVKFVIGDGISDTPEPGSASSLVAGAVSLLLSTLVFQFLALYCA